MENCSNFGKDADDSSGTASTLPAESQEEINEKIVKLFSDFNLPVETVEFDEWKVLIKALNPAYAKVMPDADKLQKMLSKRK